MKPSTAYPAKRGKVYGIRTKTWVVKVVDGKEKRFRREGWIGVSRFKDVFDQWWREKARDFDRERLGLEVKYVPWEEFKRRVLEDYKAYYATSNGSAKKADYVFREIERVIKPESISDFTAEKLKPWLIELRQRGASNATVNRYLTILYRAGELYQQWYNAKESPTASLKRLPKIKKTSIIYATDEEIVKLIKAMPSGLKWQKALYVIMWCGLRRSELCYLQWQDIDWQAQTIHVRAKPELDWVPKALKERYIPIPHELLLLLYKWHQDARPAPADYITGEHIAPDVLSAITQKAAHKAGLRSGISIHRLRASYGTKMGHAGGAAAVRDALGHSSLETTQLYVGADVERQRQVAGQIKYSVPSPLSEQEKERISNLINQGKLP